MTTEDKEILELKLIGLSAEIKANHDMQMTKLSSIECQTLKTNGRVNELEKETRIVRLFERKPILFMLVIVGAFTLYATMGFKVLLNLIK